MFANSVTGVDMQALTGRVKRSAAGLAFSRKAPVDSATALPSPEGILAEGLAEEAKATPSLMRRIIEHLDPFRGNRMREAEKALFWRRLEGLAGDVRMLGYRVDERLRNHQDNIKELEHQLALELAKRDREIARLQGDLQFQRRRLRRLDRDGRMDCETSDTACPTMTAGNACDDVTLAFEERFRGPVAEIKERLRPHLDRVRNHPTLSAGRPLLDVGCGRGEWLELLAESGIEAYGIDSNPHVIGACTSRGLEARQADALNHLSHLPDSSLGAITVFHLIEHLPLDILLRLLEQSWRALMPGGLLLLESPNPENMKVSTTTFHNDPTHMRPIPPQLAEFLVESRGFVEVEVQRLNPYPASFFIKEQSQMADLINGLMFGPQDYAILAKKP